jgi:hypothetical protein
VPVIFFSQQIHQTANKTRLIAVFCASPSQDQALSAIFTRSGTNVDQRSLAVPMR